MNNLKLEAKIQSGQNAISKKLKSISGFEEIKYLFLRKRIIA